MTRPLPPEELPGVDEHDESGAPGLLAERYELLELIGRGGMAEVHRARDRMLDRIVAVKLLAPERRVGPDAGGHARRLQDEARAAAAIDHPAAVAVHDVGTCAEGVFVVMEYLIGQTWRDELRTQGRLPERRVVRAAAEVSEALAAAHDLGIVHRDVTPANVMILADGAPKLMDFGIARAAGTARRTATGVVIGTAGYLSPEQVRDEPLDGRSDVYALGCTLYELLAGKPAFGGASTVEVASQRLRDAPPRLTGVSPPVADLVRRALARHRDERPDARQFADLLRAAGSVPAPRGSGDAVAVGSGGASGDASGDDDGGRGSAGSGGAGSGGSGSGRTEVVGTEVVDSGAAGTDAVGTQARTRVGDPGPDPDRPPAASDPYPAPRMRRTGVALVVAGVVLLLAVVVVLLAGM